MNEERNKLIKFAIVFMFVILLIFLVVTFISNMVKDYKDSKQTAVESIENIDEYIIKENIITETEVKESNLVKDYKTFYTLQNAINNYISALLEGKYDKTYSITTQDIRAKYDKATYVEKIKAYTQENFVGYDSDDIYDNVDNLKYLYLVSDNVYIGEIENISGELLKIGIVINSAENTYRVFYVEI